MSFDHPLPAALSPSRLGDFQSCPRRYQHASVERLPQPASYATTKGRIVHHVLEALFVLDACSRTPAEARRYLPAAFAAVLNETVRTDIGYDDALEARLQRECEQILEQYFIMEDPATVRTEGVELRLRAQVDDAPLLGILDRLDRDENGQLVIVDYKTGSVPHRRYDTQTFANTELYALLCEAQLGERPERIRLLYLAKGETLERPVRDTTLQARATAVGSAWRRIRQYYEAGDFPATPSVNACRFCSFQDLCRSQGVPVPTG